MSKPFLRERSYDDSAFKPVSREGIPIEKGAVLNEDYCIQHEKLFRQYANFFIQYPDLFIDLITPSDSGFHLYFYQRLTLRVLMRYKYVFVTAPRAFSKSFLSIMAEMLQGIFIPNTKRFICAPGKGRP